MTQQSPALLRILLVEDDRIQGMVITKMLEKHGYTVVHHIDPRDAVAALESDDFDIIISDYVMPEMDGLQLLRRARILRPDAVRIMLTGKGNFDLAVKAINKGEIYRFMTKPVEEGEMVTSLRLATERLELTRENALLREELRKRDELIAKLREGDA